MWLHVSHMPPMDIRGAVSALSLDTRKELREGRGRFSGDLNSGRQQDGAASVSSMKHVKLQHQGPTARVVPHGLRLRIKLGFSSP